MMICTAVCLLARADGAGQTAAKQPMMDFGPRSRVWKMEVGGARCLIAAPDLPRSGNRNQASQAMEPDPSFCSCRALMGGRHVLGQVVCEAGNEVRSGTGSGLDAGLKISREAGAKNDSLRQDSCQLSAGCQVRVRGGLE